MKKSNLISLIREMIEDELEEASKAAQDAKTQGLEYMGFGRWGKNGQMTHKSDRGRLVAVSGPDDVGLRHGKTDASKNKLYKPGSSTAQAKKLQTGPNKNKLQRLTPKVSPTVNKLRNLPNDELEPTHASGAFGKQGGDVERRLAKSIWNSVQKNNLDGNYTEKELLQKMKIKPQHAKTILHFIDKNMGFYDSDYSGINREEDGTYTVNTGNI